MRSVLTIIIFVAAATIFVGCGNPIRRAPANVYPGSADYDKRVSSFKISPSQAWNIAHEQAQTDNRLHLISRRPTVIVKRWYVFSMPQPSGANLQGYHVNGDTGEVKLVNDKKIIPHSKR